MRASLFITCYNDTLYPETGRAVVQLLERLGVELDFHPKQTCCGQMHANTGFRGEAFSQAKRLVRLYRDAEIVVIPSSSCVAMIRDQYPGLMEELGSEALRKDFAALQALGQAANPDPDQLVRVFRKLAPYFLVVLPLQVMFFAVLNCAIYRAVLRPEERGMGYFHLGPDEFRMVALAIIMFLLWLVAIFLVVFIGGLAAGTLGVFGGEAGAFFGGLFGINRLANDLVNIAQVG